jgi:hypothetical protein
VVVDTFDRNVGTTVRGVLRNVDTSRDLEQWAVDHADEDDLRCVLFGLRAQVRALQGLLLKDLPH